MIEHDLAVKLVATLMQLPFLVGVYYLIKWIGSFGTKRWEEKQRRLQDQQQQPLKGE